MPFREGSEKCEAAAVIPRSLGAWWKGRAKRIVRRGIQVGKA